MDLEKEVSSSVIQLYSENIMISRNGKLVLESIQQRLYSFHVLIDKSSVPF
jgi:hypothetical protein